MSVEGVEGSGAKAPSSGAPVPESTTGPLVDVRDVSVVFRKRRTLAAARQVRAVNDVTFHIAEGETFGLVGESGSGKSTTGRALLKLVPTESGSIKVAGHDVTHLRGGNLRRARRSMQMVFQDPYSSLDPSSTVAASIAEPLVVHEKLSAKEARSRVNDLIEMVGLRASYAERYPYEFSGGQRQRLAIARAIALNPRFIVCDEAVSALDVSTQNQVINLLERLRAEFRLTYLFIAHDLAIVRHISHRVGVMYLGRIVETGPAERVYSAPAHPYTQALLSAIPDPRRRSGRIVLEGDLPDPARPPVGCPFQTRCGFVMDICKQRVPEHTAVEGGGEVACHLQTTGPTLAGSPLHDLMPTRATSTS
ncbi:peptide/nickel transport system ATP-binding protein [Actinomadura pelletieri DSM 43383]|uniref:Peptide/nickel transport system ATP-binding protein n=1 Tax=Actinomadura pelletieri DSM 43383 TaxID=1120940 RepID=A0A495QGQ5_9ACTN|nr:ABC transporter ATP-binding protein [Actinomadura pelletieri]RKS70901.1 peptide/nickel transport system ATP-binding protein [Actinomadura pelletieri DSM 43383]